MTRRRSSPTPSPRQIDRDFPHQVALPDDICCYHNHTLIMQFCAKNGLIYHTRRVQAIWPDRRYEDKRLHCFSKRVHAEAFQSHFGGEFFDPANNRVGGKPHGPWRRGGDYERILTSGPLSVPEILRN